MGLGWVKCLLLATTVVSAAELHAAFDGTCVESYRDGNDDYYAQRKAGAIEPDSNGSEDVHKIWSVYHDIEIRRYDSPAIRRMMKSLDAKPENEIPILIEFVRQIESGEACKNDHPSKTWAEILTALKPFAN